MQITTDIAIAARYIASGRVIGAPTGTSYALAADALQGHALQRVRNLKQRPHEKTFSICLDTVLWSHHLALTQDEKKLLTHATEQALPLTLLVQPQASLTHVAQDGRVGVRVIDHPLLRDLAQAVQVPLTATSANITGGTACSTAADVLKTFPGILDATQPELAPAGRTTYDLSLACVLDGGELPRTMPSTIAYLTPDSQVVVVRQGTLSADAITKFF